jgi:hypothetical protein
MRHMGDALVWLGVILVVAAVIYFTPRFAHYVSASEPEMGRGKVVWNTMVPQADESADAAP